jgi:hypothetical protein
MGIVAVAALLGVGAWLLTGGGSTPPAMVTRLGSATGMLKPATLSTYTAKATCIEGPAFQGTILHRQGGCTGWADTPSGDRGELTVSVDVYAALKGTSADRIQAAAHKYLLDNRQGFLTEDGKYAKVTGSHPVPRLGDEAYVIDEVDSDGRTGIAKALVRFRNAYLQCEYSGDHTTTPNSLFARRTAATPQYAETAAIACARDLVTAVHP